MIGNGTIAAPSMNRARDVLPLRAQSRSEAPVVLAVDDDPASLRALEGVLRRAGCRVLCARGGEEAMAMAGSEPPDLILLDLYMPPGIDGYETIQRLRANTHLGGIPVIVLSSMQDTVNRVRALTLGAVDFVPKPFRIEEVIARVQVHLTIRRLQRELMERNAELEAANRRMKFDLDAAGRVQRAMLPTCTPVCGGYEIAWAWRSCFEVGGDLLDAFSLSPDTIAFYLLDVSGHGVSACLLATSLARSLTPRPDRSSLVVEPSWDGTNRTPVPPSEVLRRLNVMNRMDAHRNPHFVTMVYGLLNLPTGHVRWSSAGHPLPVLIHPDGSCETSGTSALPIGVDPDTRFEDCECTLAPGDRLALYSDGACEQRGAQGDQFGLDRLKRLLSEGGLPLTETIQRAATEVESWTWQSGLSDDLSLLGIGRDDG